MVILDNARTSGDSDLIEDDYFASMLSPEGLIQIDDWIFKVDLKNVEVYALIASDADLNDNLISKLKEEQPKDAKIRVFSTNDDVLDMIQNGQLGESSNQRLALFCSESGAASKKVEEDGYYETDRRLSCKVVYQKAGIYFSLQAKVQSQNRFGGIWYAQKDAVSLEYIADWDPKCRDSDYDRGVLYNGGDGNELNHRPYESTRGLHHYTYSVLFGNNVIQVGFLNIQD